MASLVSNTVHLFEIAWLFYLVPVLVVIGPVWLFTRRLDSWTRWDFGIVAVPFPFWCLLFMSGMQNAGCGNIYVEPFLLGWTAGISRIVRIFWKSGPNQKKSGILLWGFVCLATLGLRILMPGMNP